MADLKRITRGMESAADAIQTNFDTLNNGLGSVQATLNSGVQDSLAVKGDITAQDIKLSGEADASTINIQRINFVDDGGNQQGFIRFVSNGYAGAGLYFHDGAGDHKLGN